MEYRILGSTGEKISEVGLGAWQFSESWGMLDYENAKKIISSAMVNGVNFIDTAIAYGWGKSEEFIGKSLKELVARDNFMIATKIPGEFLAEHDVILATVGSLRRLQTDHIDLMQIHWPPVWNNIPTCEYMRALEKLVSMGLIDYIGVSNFPPILLDEANSCLSREEIVSEQVRYNLIEREAEKEIIPYTLEAGMNLIAWSPLAKGALSGKYNFENLPKFTDVRAGEPTFIPQNFKEILPVIEKLKEIASKYSKTPAQVALNWLLTSYDNVLVIPGAKSPEQVAENAGASGWSLSFEDWAALDSLSKKVTIHRSLKAI
jgi:aryl-alcohol dehydrogenase-like predicted oxidoreductase